MAAHTLHPDQASMKVLSLLLRNGCAVTHAAMLSGSLNESPELIAQEYGAGGLGVFASSASMKVLSLLLRN